MAKPYSILVFIILLTCCSQPQPAGKRVFVAKGNISFVLPNSSLVYSKPMLWGADYGNGDYGEAGAFYHSPDSSTTIDIYVSANPSEVQGVPWRIHADREQIAEILLDETHNQAIIEKVTTDSLSRSVEVDYHLAKWPPLNRRSQPSYAKKLVIYAPYRTIKFWFTTPDSTKNRQLIAAARASIIVEPTYLQAVAKPYDYKKYKD